MFKTRVLSTAALTAGSVVQLGTYSPTNHYFEVSQPDGDNLGFEELLVVGEATISAKVAPAYRGGMMRVQTTGTIAAGDRAGTASGTYTLEKNDNGHFYVTYAAGGWAIVTPMMNAYTPQFCVITQEVTDSVSDYKMELVDATLTPYGAEITIDRILGYEAHGSAGQDCRNWKPRHMVDAIVPCCQHYDTSAQKWFIDLAFEFIGLITDRSIAFDADQDNRVMAVWKA